MAQVKGFQGLGLVRVSLPNLSVTDGECHWKKKTPQKKLFCRCLSYSRTTLTDKGGGRPTTLLAREISNEDVAWFKSELQDTQCGMTWLLSPEPELHHQGPPTVPELVREFQDQGLDRVLDALELTEEQHISIEGSTVRQRRNPQWQRHRQGRLAASNFGAVLSRRPASSCPSLMKRLLEGQHLDGVLAVNWGSLMSTRG